MYTFLLSFVTLLLTPLVLSLDVEAPAQNEIVDITKLYKARWIPAA